MQQKFSTGREKQYVNCKKENKNGVYGEKICVHCDKENLIVAILNAIRIGEKKKRKYIEINKKTMLTVSKGWRMGCVTGACTNQTTWNENWADIWILWVIVVVVIIVVEWSVLAFIFF